MYFHLNTRHMARSSDLLVLLSLPWKVNLFLERKLSTVLVVNQQSRWICIYNLLLEIILCPRSQYELISRSKHLINSGPCQIVLSLVPQNRWIDHVHLQFSGWHISCTEIRCFTSLHYFPDSLMLDLKVAINLPIFGIWDRQLFHLMRD